MEWGSSKSFAPRRTRLALAWGSVSTMRTRRFFRASPAAMFRAHVVFPTPPLLFTMAMTRWETEFIRPLPVKHDFMYSGNHEYMKLWPYRSYTVRESVRLKA